jgi:hypothetical protein
VRSRWLSPRALLLHLALVVLVTTMAGLTWWQANRALSGNTLSYVYSFEWPVLAGVVVYMWWDLLHDRPKSEAGGEQAASASPDGDERSVGIEPSSVPDAVPRYREDEDEDLAAYNRYLAELSASGRRKTWRHPT